MITERHSMATLPSLPISFKNKTWCNFAEFSEGWGNIISFLAFGLFCDFSKGLYLVASFIGATPFGQNQKRQWPAVLAGEARQCGWLGTRLLPAGAHNLQAGHSKNRSGGYVFM